MGESEDIARDQILSALDAPTARLPQGAHWRASLWGGTTVDWTLAIAARGPVALAGLSLRGLEQVESGDADIDAWVIFFTDRPDKLSALLQTPQHRAVLRQVVARNGPYTNTVVFRPSVGPRAAGVHNAFPLLDNQTAESLVEQCRALAQVAGWMNTV
jgi:hypothetical protein